MTILDPNDGHITLINTFKVKSGKAEELIALLAQATEEGIRHVPGFVSANLHVSLDGTKVVNYAQWRSKEEFDAMRNSDSFKAHTRGVEPLIEGFEPELYRLRFSHSEAADEATA